MKKGARGLKVKLGTSKKKLAYFRKGAWGLGLCLGHARKREREGARGRWGVLNLGAGVAIKSAPCLVLRNRPAGR